MNKLVLIFIYFSMSTTVNAQKINVNIQRDVAYFTEGNDSILNYQIAEKSMDDNYARANYVHPLYALDETVLTEDFPLDHLHHRGIFWAWHQLYIGDKNLGDGWEIKDFSWEVKSVKKLKAKGKAKGIIAKVLWKSAFWKDTTGNLKPVVKETTTIKVYPSNKNYRIIDFEISLLALEPNMSIGGSNDAKGYGGFSPRIRLTDDIQFTSKNGTVVPDNLPVTANGWIDISGSLGKNKNMAGITVMPHPANPGYPNPWILRSKRSMQNAVYPFPGAKLVSLPETRPTILRYRLVVHKGDSNAVDLEGIYETYKNQ